MNENTILGVDIATDLFATPEAQLGQWRAGAAIVAGHTVIYDTAVNTGKQCVTLTASGTAHDEHLICGAYSSHEGKARGGTGAATASVGITGKNAVTGDFVHIASGPVKVLVDGGATDVLVKDRLMAFTTAGLLAKDLAAFGTGGTAAVYPAWPAVALEGQTAAATATMVLLRGPF